MRRLRRGFLVLAAAVGVASAAFAQGGGSSDPPPSLEYRPKKVVIPEPKAPHPLPPKTVFAQAIGSFGIMTGSFDRPVDVVRDGSGDFYVLDAGNSRVQKFDRFGEFITAFGSGGSRDGQFKSPSALAVGRLNDTNDTEVLYVVDTGNDRIQIYFIADLVKDPVRPIMPFKVFGSRGSWKGDFNSPRDIAVAVDQGGKRMVYVLDSGNDRVQRFFPDGALEQGVTFELRGGAHTDLTSIAWSDERFGYLYLFGPGCLIQQFSLKGGTDGILENSWPAIAPDSGLCVPGRIEVGGREPYVYVLDVGNSLLMCFNPDIGGMYRWALRGAEVPFSKPLGVAVNPEGDEVLVADTENNIVQKFTLR